MPFVKGQSGNPSGKRKGTKDKPQVPVPNRTAFRTNPSRDPNVVEACRAASPAIVRVLIGMSLNKNLKPEIRMRAGEIVLNRAYGMPRQAVDFKNEGLPMFVAMLPPTAVDADAWAAKAAQLNGGPKLIEGEFEAAEAVPMPVSEEGKDED